MEEVNLEMEHLDGSEQCPLSLQSPFPEEQSLRTSLPRSFFFLALFLNAAPANSSALDLGVGSLGRSRQGLQEIWSLEKEYSNVSLGL